MSSIGDNYQIMERKVEGLILRRTGDGGGGGTFQRWGNGEILINVDRKIFDDAYAYFDLYVQDGGSGANGLWGLRPLSRQLERLITRS